MKRTFAAGIAVAVLAGPVASAGATKLELTARQGEPPKPAVAFDVKVKNGKPKRVRDFEFAGVIVTCTEGTYAVDNVGNPLPNMKVTKKTKKFRDDFTANDGAQRIGVSGKIKQRGRVVEGKLRVRGAFTDPDTGGPVTNCDSGVVSFRARRQ